MVRLCENRFDGRSRGSIRGRRRPAGLRGPAPIRAIRSGNSAQNRGSALLRRPIASYDRDLELAEYQRLSRRTASYPREAWLAYPALGLCGEAGEVAEHAKKAIRDDGGEISSERRAAIAAELGDVLWYVSQIATELDLDLDQVAEANLRKLRSRQRRGVLSGSGDNR